MKKFQVIVILYDDDIEYYLNLPFYKKFFYRLRGGEKIMKNLESQYDVWQCEVDEILNENKEEK